MLHRNISQLMIVVIVALGGLILSPAHASPRTPRVSLNIKDAPVRDVLEWLARQADQNVVMTDAVVGTVTVRWKEVPVSHALRSVLRLRGLALEQHANVWLVMTEAEAAARRRR